MAVSRGQARDPQDKHLVTVSPTTAGSQERPNVTGLGGEVGELWGPGLIKSPTSTQPLAVYLYSGGSDTSQPAHSFISEKNVREGEGQETGSVVNLMEGLAGSPIKSTGGSVLGNVLPLACRTGPGR